MSNCKNCLENSWSYKYEDDKTILATCNICGNEVSFNAKKKIRIKAGDLCRKCKNPIIYKDSKFNKKKLLKNYYFTGYYYCPKCKTFYMSEEFKIYNKPKKEVKAEYKIVNGKRFLKINGKFKEVMLNTLFDKKENRYLKVCAV